jgi:hypothetical protein
MLPRLSLLVLFPLCLAAVSTAAAMPSAPDYTALQHAAHNFAAIMEKLSTDIPRANHATSAAKVIEMWAAANTALALEITAILQAHPELSKLHRTPPEMVEADAALRQVREKYPSVPSGAGALAKKFGTDPQMVAALQTFQRSLEGLKFTPAMEALEKAGRIFRELTAVDVAINRWALKNHKKAGDLPTAAELGNPITITPLGTRPSLSRATFVALSSSVEEDFWKPFTVR